MRQLSGVIYLRKVLLMFSISIEREDRLWQLRAFDDTRYGRACIGVMQVRRWQECFCVGVASNLIVSPEFRRQRVADRLMLRAEEAARLNGMSLLLSTIRLDNPASIGVVTGRGWMRYGEMRNPKTGNDLAVFGKMIVGAVFEPETDD
jgi:GNAT superfamily N-acetyltransferase